MSRELTTFDVLFRDLFNSQSGFNILSEAKAPHPVDIFEDSKGLTFEIACTGLTKEDVEINIEHDVLKISYNKPPKQEEQAERTYQTRGVSKRSFNLAYKISSKYDLSKGTAAMENGLLNVQIPFAEEAKPRTLQIK
ncbi:IbpA Molecular chaperone (small heat shock protein) [uncultured Caudovirales phage]|uniref:IbpA Molecular chaperone (Small heat shock protein) n=1 Tax=uncultured Caudovirales phage TaxID=2100421 RepID=A0A6J5M7M1_9CAUD|nr:IbpA Molecular chaperone (small heat shock protein) [uncultured Caudovirales phage]